MEKIPENPKIVTVSAKPNSSSEKIEETGPGKLKVSVKEPLIRGLANKAIIRLLAGYFHVPESSVKIISGYTSRRKLIKIG